MSGLKNGKSFIGYRFGHRVVVEFKGMIADGSHKRQSVWRANCDCKPDGSNFMYETIRTIRENGMCKDCAKKTDARRKKQ